MLKEVHVSDLKCEGNWKLVDYDCSTSSVLLEERSVLVYLYLSFINMSPNLVF